MVRWHDGAFRREEKITGFEMKVLLVGNGAREHAIAAKLAEDCELYSVMSKKNPAIAGLSKEHWICDIESPASIAKAIAGKNFDLGFASPDATLAAGISDLLEKSMAVASPSKAASRIEWDKSFMRALMSRHSIRGAPLNALVKTPEEAIKLMRDLGPVAIKPLGLTGGKGVKVSGDHFNEESEGLAYAEALIKKDGLALIEEKLVGEEFTFQAFSDGSKISTMPPVQDHKRAFVGEKGPNTGGMGSYSSGKNLPFLENSDLEEATAILQGVINALKKEGTSFRGILYGQFMSTSSGPKVIEFNARFGDPEAMNVIPLLKDSLSEIFLCISQGSLKNISFSDDCTVVKYLVPQGYPDNPLKDSEVHLDRSKLEQSGASAYYASVYEKDGKIYTSSSRSFGILGRAKTVEEAEKIAESGCRAVSGPLWHRSDIGTKKLIDQKISRMKALRGNK
jgi:phosphoribosylamine--glycine ligase